MSNAHGAHGGGGRPGRHRIRSSRDAGWGAQALRCAALATRERLPRDRPRLPWLGKLTKRSRRLEAVCIAMRQHAPPASVGRPLGAFGPERRADDLKAPIPLQHHRAHEDDRHRVHLPRNDRRIFQVRGVVAHVVPRPVGVQPDAPHAKCECEEVARERHTPVGRAKAHEQIVVEEETRSLLAHQDGGRVAERAVAANDQAEGDMKCVVQHVQSVHETMYTAEDEVHHLEGRKDDARKLRLDIWIEDVGPWLAEQFPHSNVGERRHDHALELGDEFLGDVHGRILPRLGRGRQPRHERHVHDGCARVPEHDEAKRDLAQQEEEVGVRLFRVVSDGAQQRVVAAEVLAGHPPRRRPR
mmetsp:Transcript_57550/g.132179  ORF Transcript_57550/g.132179 Transcript_57550/m.132179 type:complete len:356 (+) Transcript_57550:536-1603(+)